MSLSTFNSSEQHSADKWRFLIKAPYLGNLSVIYDAENKGLTYDENKGLKSIAEIRYSVIKSLITDSMASIRLVT